MDKLTIKLLHERRNNNRSRKVDGSSGSLYLFTWSAEHSAYVYTTDKQEEVDDIFNSQGRAMGSYFAPVITLTPKVVAQVSCLPAKEDAPMAVAVAATIVVEKAVWEAPKAEKPKGKAPPPTPPLPVKIAARAA